MQIPWQLFTCFLLFVVAGRIFVGICLALVFVPIGLPRWGSIERGKVELSFGLFQSQKTFPAPNGAHAVRAYFMSQTIEHTDLT